jgi:hypothetical protein
VAGNSYRRLKKFDWPGDYAGSVLAAFNGTWDWTAIGTLEAKRCRLAQRSRHEPLSP